MGKVVEEGQRGEGRERGRAYPSICSIALSAFKWN